MMTVSAEYHPRTGLGGATWPLALILGFSLASLTQFASAAPITQPAEASSTVGGEPDTQVSPEDEPDANSVPTETELPSSESADSPLAGSEINTQSKVPRSEDLLQLEPTTSGATARFSDVLNPPAETTTSQPTSPEVVEPTAYNVPIVVDSSVLGHIRYFNTAIRARFEQ